jgi:RNA polymerase sigma-70 factor, ECF subfamily
MHSMKNVELIAQSLDGNQQAYAQLVDRYKNAVYFHSFAIVKDEDAAEDIAQEAFISAYYNLARYNSKYKLSTWLFKISTNKCLNHIKKRAKQAPVDDTVIQAIVSGDAGPDKRAVHDELRRAVDNLRPTYQAVISLHYWQGLDYAATALAMDAPVNSVKVWLKRAKEQLRKELS